MGEVAALALGRVELSVTLGSVEQALQSPRSVVLMLSPMSVSMGETEYFRSTSAIQKGARSP